MTSARAQIGDNNPPTPFDDAKKSINDLYDEAKGWLDGEKIDTLELAEGVAKLLNMIRKTRKTTDDSRKGEVKPLNDAKAEIQGRYNPLLAKADLATETCKKALAPWLIKLEAEKKAIAEAARIKAEEDQKAAREAYQAANPENLEEKANADALIEEAETSTKIATRAAKDTAKAAGGVGRAVSLRTTRKPVLVDDMKAARHYWKTRRVEMQEFFISLAEKDVRAKVQSIPGFDIIEERTVA